MNPATSAAPALEPRLQGKTATVTGARRSIGRAVAEALAEQGAYVVVHYRGGREEAAEATVKDLTSSGGEAIAIGRDLSDSAAVFTLFQQTAEHFGVPGDANSYYDVLVQYAFGDVVGIKR